MIEEANGTTLEKIPFENDFNKLGKQLGGALTDAYNTSAKWVQKRFDNVVEISKALKSKWGKLFLNY